MDSRLDLVTIQFGENVRDLKTYERDFVELIKYISFQVPKAKIIVIGDFWGQDEDRDIMKQNACKMTGVTYISLRDIAGDTTYMAGKGTKVYSDDGAEHIIDHDGVAGHPGDKGMEYIAKMIVGELK